MLVGKRMSRPARTIGPNMPINEALVKMRQDRVRRYPVVDEKGKLIGIVSEKDLMNASPSQATSLSVWELNYLVSKITVEKVMERNVITVSEDTPIEEAARIMADKKIGGLPVVSADGTVIGIITETDLFKSFLELMGARSSGIRVTALVSEVPGKLSDLTSAIYNVGGNILSLGTFLGESSGTRTITFRVSQVKLEDLKKAIQPVVEKIEDIQELDFD